MSDRWKYQIKVGIFWGILMSLANVFFEVKERSLIEQIFLLQFYIKLFFFIVLGIFVLGYVNWKTKVKNEYKDEE